MSPDEPQQYNGDSNANNAKEEPISQPIKEGENRLLRETKLLSPRQHMLSTLALCMSTLTHSYLLISVFPYSGYMAIDLIDGVTEETAGGYAGFIAASFMLGRTFTSYHWGKWADTYGRLTVMHASLGLSGILTMLFGLSPNFTAAIVIRGCLGLANGLIGTTKTLVSELAQGDPKLETRGMGLVMGMWGFAFIFSPALSGALAEPVKQYPSNELIQGFRGFLSEFPFVLPNLLGAVFCGLTMLFVSVFVHETLPEEKRRSPRLIPQDFVDWLKSVWLALKPCGHQTAATSEEQLPLISSEAPPKYDPATSDTAHDRTMADDIRDATMAHTESCSMLAANADDLDISVPKENAAGVVPSNKSLADQEATLESLWQDKATRRHLMVYFIYSFVGVSVEEAFPLFCISIQGGLGLSELSIGKILSGSGLIYAVGQYFIFATMVNRLGLYTSLRLGSLISQPLIALIPVAVWINGGARDDHISWSTFYFMCIVMGIYRIFASVFFSSISIAMNRTVPTTHRGTMNGVSMLGGSFAKAFGPASAGVLVAFCIGSGVFPPHIGAAIVFAVLAGIGVFGTVLCFVYLEPPDVAYS